MKTLMSREIINKIHLRRINERIIVLNREISAAKSEDTIGELLEELNELQSEKKNLYN